jgi:hypothetical protein
MAFEGNIRDAILANKREREEAKAAATPAVAAPTTTIEQNNPAVQPAPVQTTTQTSPTVEKPTVAVPVVDQPEKPKAVVEPTKVETAIEPAADSLEEPQFDLDKVLKPTTTPVIENEPKPTAVDLKKLGSAFNLEVNNEDEFVTKIKEQFKQLESPIDGLSEQLKQAIDIEKKGGDWKSFVTATALDVNALEPVKLFERDFENKHSYRFKKEDGTIDYEKLDDEIDSIPLWQKVAEGERLKQDIAMRQQAQKAAVIAQAAQQQERFQKSLSEAVKELPSLLPYEKYGMKIEPRHSSYFYEGVANGSLIKKHLGNIDPATLAKMDSKKIIRTIAIAELGEGIAETQFKKGEVAGKKNLLQTTQNPQLRPQSFLPSPAEPEAKTTTDMLVARKEKMKPRNSL